MGKYFYQEEGARCGDVIPKYIDGKFEIFYLKGYLEPKTENASHGWHRLSTRDFCEFSPETAIGVLGGTGDLIYAFGKWHLFACIFPEGKQYITHYISKDGSLDNWEYISEDTFGPDGVIYDFTDFRDPRIEYNEAKEEFTMYFCARAKDAHVQNGCVGKCVSKDLKKWTFLEPEYYPERFNGACECPDYFTMGKYEYLFFSEYTNLFGTYYVYREAGSSDWIIPFNHRVDTRAFYAAKTASSGSHRYLFGWNPTKEEDIFGYWPSKLKDKDLRTFDWGGALVIHELIQKENGELYLQAPKVMDGIIGEKEEIVVEKMTKGFTQCGDALNSNMISAQQIARLNRLGDRFKVSAKFIDAGANEFGFMLRMREDCGEYYTVGIEPRKRRMFFKSHIRCLEEGGKTFPYDVELESFFDMDMDNKGEFYLVVIAEGENAVAYINNQVAMSFKMCDLMDGYLGIYSFGKSEISEITLYN